MSAVKQSPDLATLFGEALERIAPRVLTQVSRDPGSPTYGSFDRNWWHYKIRDFSSIILQQGAYFLWELAKLDEFADRRESLQRLAAAGAHFWARRARCHGAFEEYYPWEQGYPPLAFSTLAVAKLVRDGAVGLPEMEEALLAAGAQLSARFEAQAGNQQVAGIAALAMVRNLIPTVCSASRLEELVEKTLALQDEEGWFEEYDGPDLGYLAVTIDCLWDLHDTTGDERFLISARQALGFIHRIVCWCGGSPGMLNARNTDYLVPFGLVRFAFEGKGEIAHKAGDVVEILYRDLGSPGHFLAAVDDRYLCHYIGHSFVRALSLVRAFRGVKDLSSPAEFAEEPRSFSSSGYELIANVSGKALVAGFKGGCFLWCGPEGRRIADYGWVVSWGSSCAVTHWWSQKWKRGDSADGLEVTGQLFEHSASTSSPLKHMALRILSLLFGRRLIGLLKGKLIFKNVSGSITFQRRIVLCPDKIRVRDEFCNLPPGAKIERAPRSSKRHVSSADSFHNEDLLLAPGCRVDENRMADGTSSCIETTYRC